MSYYDDAHGDRERAADHEALRAALQARIDAQRDQMELARQRIALVEGALTSLREALTVMEAAGHLLQQQLDRPAPPPDAPRYPWQDRGWSPPIL